MKKTRRKLKGFTLVELLVVIAILAVIAAIALPKYNESKQKSLVTAHNSNVRILEGAAQNYLASEGNPAATVTWNKENVGDSKYIKNFPDVPKGLKDSSGTVITAGYVVTITPQGEVTVTPASIQ